MSRFLRLQGKYSEAESLYVLDKDHPTTKVIRDNLQYLQELRKEQP